MNHNCHILIVPLSDPVNKTFSSELIIEEKTLFELVRSDFTAILEFKSNIFMFSSVSCNPIAKKFDETCLMHKIEESKSILFRFKPVKMSHTLKDLSVLPEYNLDLSKEISRQ